MINIVFPLINVINVKRCRVMHCFVKLIVLTTSTSILSHTLSMNKLYFAKILYKQTFHNTLVVMITIIIEAKKIVVLINIPNPFIWFGSIWIIQFFIFFERFILCIVETVIALKTFLFLLKKNRQLRTFNA